MATGREQIEAQADRRTAAALAAMTDGVTPEAEVMRLTVEAFGVSEREAAFLIAVQRGEIDGDVVTVDGAGDIAPPGRSP